MSKPLTITSPPPLPGGAVYPAPPKPGDPTVNAWNFYGQPIVNPGGCSAYDQALLGGYNQTCLNVTNGYGVPYSNGSICALNTKYRRWADAMRFCLQSSTAGAINASMASGKCETCFDVVDQIATSHSGCNTATGFCAALQDPAAAWCFGQSLGNAWGPFLTGTCRAGPAEQGQCNCPLNATAPCLADDDQCVKDCNSTTCPNGCCDANGKCHINETANCGTGGNACGNQDCSSTLRNGVCENGGCCIPDGQPICGNPACREVCCSMTIHPGTSPGEFFCGRAPAFDTVSMQASAGTRSLGRSE